MPGGGSGNNSQQQPTTPKRTTNGGSAGSVGFESTYGLRSQSSSVSSLKIPSADENEKAESESGRSDKKSEFDRSGMSSEKLAGGFATPERIDVDRSRGPTPLGADIDDSDDRMSISSRLSTRSHRNTPLHKTSGDGFEKELSFNPAASPASASEKMLNLAMVPVISDQLVYDIVNKERNFDQVDVHLFVKKCLDLLAVKNAAEIKIEQLRHKVAELEMENRHIRESKVRMQLRVEQEEEYISNMLLKRIQNLKNDKEQLALKYEQEEERLTNDLMRKLTQLEGERDELSNKLRRDQDWVVRNLLEKIRRLETEIQTNQKSLEQLRREKVDLENSLEHEQEALFNTLGKRMDSLEAEKRRLQQHNDQLQDQIGSMRSEMAGGNGGDDEGGGEFGAGGAVTSSSQHTVESSGSSVEGPAEKMAMLSEEKSP